MVEKSTRRGTRRGWRARVGRGDAREDPSARSGGPGSRGLRSTSLTEACASFLSDIRARISTERVVVIACFEDYCEHAGTGVTRDEAADLVRLLVRDGRRRALPEWPDEPTSFEQLRLTPPDTFQSATLIPVVEFDRGFCLGIVADVPVDAAAVDEILASAARAAPDMMRVAELDALRSRAELSEAWQRRSLRALDVLPDPVLVTDAHDAVLISNARAEQLLNARADDGAGRQHAVETNNLYFSAFKARVALGRDVPGEHRELLLVDPQDGTDLLFEVLHRPFEVADGGSDGTIYILRDVTDLRHVTLELEAQYGRAIATEHAARRESERLQVIIENAGIPILVTDDRTNIVLMNREAEHLLDPAHEDGEAGDPLDGQPNGLKLTGLINDFLLRPQRLRRQHLELVDAEGTPFPARAVSTKVLDADDQTTAVVTVLHDLTHEVENERLASELRLLNEQLEERVVYATRELAERNTQLERQRSELERASRLKTEFLATMSHELRTPINATLGYNSLLREGLFGPLTERQREALERMRISAEHLLSIINDILDLSKVEAGRLVLHAAEIEPRELLTKLGDGVRPAAAAKGLHFEIDVEQGLPRLVADDLRLGQVLINLLANAVKFTDEGSVTLRARLDRSGERMLFEVEDTGIGIEEHEIDAIFEEFRQIDQSITREHGGTGLGLAISRKLVSLMHGRIEVESEPGSGTLFRVSLPLMPPSTTGR